MPFRTIKQVPIYEWPGAFTRERQASRFGSTYAQTMDLLWRELDAISAQGVVMQIALRPEDFRTTDGLPRARAVPSHPGVILTFQSRHGALSYPCDTFTDWQSNLRAIALSLEALRKVDRYGVTRRGEQYRGFAALPAPTPVLSVDTLPGAVAFISKYAGQDGEPVITETAAGFQSAYRRAARRLHPDTPGGDAELFKLLQRAKETVEK